MKHPTSLSLPVLPIRDRVVFPHINSSLIIGRPRSIAAVRKGMDGDQRVFIVTQRNVKTDNPQREDLFEIGTIAEILNTSQLPDGFLRIRVIGRQRAKLVDLVSQQGYLKGDANLLNTPSLQSTKAYEMEAMRRILIRKFEDYAKRLGRIPPEIVPKIKETASLDNLADLVSEGLLISLDEKQDLLDLVDVPKRLTRLIEVLDGELEILQIERKIQSRVHRQIEKSQREYYLNEQMRAIQKELKKKDDHGQEADEYQTKIKKLGMPPESEESVLKEAQRLEKMMPFSPEATVIRGYLDWVISLPWSTQTKDQINVEKAKALLESDHYGLEKPKERLLEYLAVLKLTKKIKGPVLCFVGPPGTGKTSIVKSLAKALGRKFVRISLGGVRDEAEIRGHRRTYIGSLPGRIIQALKKAQTKNPIILLDELDKMGNDWRGDPSAALLEVLDPEQNSSFMDHFLDVGFDLSQAIFIATANSVYNIPATLLDRLEVLRFSAYTTDEKVSIARQFLIQKELKEHGLPKNAITFQDDTLRKIIHVYTQEAGVRGLQRKLAQICRKIAVDWVKESAKKGKAKPRVIKLKDVPPLLGVPEFVRPPVAPNAIGIATGLAWTEHGGETLTVEVTTTLGPGKIILTGKLGSVMQESAHAAFSLIKSRAKKLKIPEKMYQKHDLHVHVPEGAVPKDGPSAGIAVATAIVSALTGIPVKENVAMTGEVTLTGRVLAIGGLKEKVLAAFREGIGTVLYPKSNTKDLPEIPEKILKNIKLVAVETVDDVFHHALQLTLPQVSSSHRKGASIHRHN